MNYPNDTTTFGEFIASLPTWAKAVGTVLTLLALGAGLSDYVGLPGQVQENSQAVVELRSFDQRMEGYMRRNDQKLDRVLCHLQESRRSEPSWERCER